MLDWTEAYALWEGTAEELGRVASHLAPQFGLHPSGPDTHPFNERLVRSYVQANAIERPERRGREAYFGYRQLVQCLAVRVLLNDGWPLAKIADYIQLTEFDALLELLPKPGSTTAAQQLVNRFQRERAGALNSPDDSQISDPSVIYASQAGPPPNSVAGNSAELLRRRQQHLTVPTVASATARRESDVCVRIDLAPGCQVYVDRELLRQLSAEQADQLGGALSHALIDRRLTAKGERK
jgi:hypothetical protein